MNVPTKKAFDYRHSVNVLDEDAFIRNFGCKSAKAIPDSICSYLCEYDDGWVYGSACFEQSCWVIRIHYDVVYREKSFQLALLARKIRLAVDFKFRTQMTLLEAGSALSEYQRQYEERQQLEQLF